MASDEPEFNPYDDEHDWCYKAANQFCGKKLDIGETLRTLAPSLKPQETQNIIMAMQVEYAKLFDAFVRGAVYGRAQC